MSDESPPPANTPRDDESLWETLRKVPLRGETLVFLILSVGDILMTSLLLGRGGFYESNGLARWFLHRWGLQGMINFKLGMMLFIVVLSQIIAKRQMQKARWVLRIGSFAVGVVVVYSLFLHLRY